MRSLTRTADPAALQAMGSELDAQEAEALFRQADCNGDGVVDADELAAVLALCHADGELHRWAGHPPGREWRVTASCTGVPRARLAGSGG